jgi:ABC-type oligopeptide transport system substrate-binding subunit
MRQRRTSFQEDLFESSEQQEMQRQIREFDTLIARALKAKHYEEAKAFTARQEKLIQKLMSMNPEANGS